MNETEFQTKVLDNIGTQGKAIEKQGETLQTLTASYDNLDKSTKKAFEELTALKQAANDQATMLQAINKIQNNLRREMRMANDPVGRLLANEESREFLNGAFRLACKQPFDTLTKFQQDLLKRTSPTLSTTTPGSTYITGDLFNEIYDALATYGIWNTFKVVRLGTKTTTFPVATAAPVAYFVAENGQISADSTRDGTSVSLAPRYMAVLDYASREMLADSEFDIPGMLMRDFMNAIAKKLDWACTSADGTNDTTDGAFTGVFYGGTAATAANGNTTVANLDLDDFVNCLTTVDSSILTRSPKWWMNPQILAKICLIRDGNGRPIFQLANEAPTPMGVGSILGYPVILGQGCPSTDSASAVVAVFGDPEGGITGIRNEFELATADQFNFDYMRVYYRGVMRAGFVIRSATSFAKLTLAAA